MTLKQVKLMSNNYNWKSGLTVYLLLIFIISACSSVKLKTFDYSKPVDTSSRVINYQDKKVYNIDDVVFADNQFDGARLNGFEQLNDSTFQVTILPENEPINQSPHYAFRIWSKQVQTVYVKLNYPTSRHRYVPKLSNNGENWKPIDSTAYQLIDSAKNALLKVSIDDKKLWIAAQELKTSTEAISWSKQIATHKDVRFNIVGKSKLNRDLVGLDIYSKDPKNKDVIVVLSRQHPPEVTGYLAMQSFVEEILKDNRLQKDFRNKYRMLVFPMLNPDGVDLGHWRHNTGGIDLNRDWAYYRQDEVKTIVNNIVDVVNESKNKVILGLDFHSTQEDLYYSFSDDMHSSIYPFKDYWMDAIDNAIPNYTPDDQPFPLSSPISKGWFYKQFNAESLTYEIGDETPRDFIKLKAEVAAREMMKLLILRN
jgi:hypothetical protein